jgi:ring-1,2-phenylacetyl-CoA epoxidase subunit PaaE
MFRFHSLKVKSVERVADDAVCLCLDVPATLRQEFAFHAGQYVTVRKHIAGREHRRTYSIAVAPGTSALKLGIRIQPGGLMSGELAANLKPGDLLDVGTPLGRFKTAISPERDFSYVAFAAGSGITPILSLAADILARETHSRFTLIYGNRNIARTMFLEETLGLKNKYMHRFAVHFVMSREPQQTAVLNGRIDGAKIRELAAHIVEINTADEYLICGPGQMVDEASAAIKQLNGQSPIRFERFAAQGASPVAIAIRDEPSSTVSAADPLLASVSVTMDGRRRTFPMATTDLSVLEAAERAGLELPFSCRSGICATCRAKIIAGSAVMAHNIGLEQWEIDAGFVLCCQARPISQAIELSYDEK